MMFAIVCGLSGIVGIATTGTILSCYYIEILSKGESDDPPPRIKATVRRVEFLLAAFLILAMLGAYSCDSAQKEDKILECSQ